MQIKPKLFILLLVISALFAETSNIKAQRKKAKDIFIGLEIMPGYSSLNISPKPPDLVKYSSTKVSEINFGINGQYFFNKTYAIESGIFLLTHNIKAAGISYSTSFTTTDSENESYIRTVTGDSITESTILRTVNIPLHFVYNYQLSKKFTVYAGGGPGITLAIQNKVHGQGTFSYKGYYPLTHLPIGNLPPYGFVSNVPVDNTNKLPLKPFLFFVSVSGGISYAINKQYKIFLSANYYNSVTEITKTNKKDFHVSNETNSYNSFMTNWKKPIDVISISLGIRMKLIFAD